MMVLMVFVVFVLVVFIFVLVYKNRIIWFKLLELKWIVIYINIKVVFLWFFGFVCILYEFFNVFMDLSCWVNIEIDDIKC